MSKDWLDNSIYDHFDGLGLSGLAWECLRRNESYRSDYAAREGYSAYAAWGYRRY